MSDPILGNWIVVLVSARILLRGRHQMLSNDSEGKCLSDYEKRRLENIKRNNARLRSLGLISELEEKRSNAIASGISIEIIQEDDSDGESSDDGEWSAIKDAKKRKKKKSVSVVQREGFRKSKRLKGEKADIPEDIESLFPSDPALMKKEREERVKECREVRLRAANALAACGGEAVAKQNPTATYEHCLMRVRSMTEKGLANRIKAIERAAGKHCIIKMAIFKSCLQDENLWDLAALSSEALERLKGLQPIPED